MTLNLQDVEEIRALYPEHQIELRAEKVIIMNPSDSVSSNVGVEFSTLLNMWVHQQSLGQVLDASTGFLLPNGDLLSPDVAFVSRKWLKRTPRTYLTGVPELIVEIKSSYDHIRQLEYKIALFLGQGVQVGLLIDPDKRTVSIYRSTGQKDVENEVALMQKTVLQDGETLSIPELFPGWEVPVTSLWPPVYK